MFKSTMSNLLVLIFSTALAFQLSAHGFGQSTPSLDPPHNGELPRPNPDASGKYHVGDGVTAPKLIYSVDPEFPEKLRKKKISTACTVGLNVDTNGNPQEVHSISSTPNLEGQKPRGAQADLQQACIKPVAQYRFSPATFQGKPVSVDLKVEVNFKIF